MLGPRETALSQEPPPVVNGLISAWFDNFDFVVFTPNGCRETHSNSWRILALSVPAVM